MSAGDASVLAVLVAFCIGGGLVRRGVRPRTGWASISAAVAGALALATLGHFRSLLMIVVILGFTLGFAADRPGDPIRRALGLLGIGVAFFALLIGGRYAT